MTQRPLAIVLGVDTPIGLTVIRELGSRGVAVHAVGSNARAIGAASRWATGFSVRPEGPIAIWLPGLIRQTGAGALLAVSENDLVALAALDPVIEGCAILTPRAAPLAIVLDKRRTLEVARTLSIDGPACWQPVVGDDFAVKAAGLVYPLILKWADPAATASLRAAKGIDFVKAEHVGSPSALLAALARYDPVGDWPLVQTYCPGIGLGQMFHMHHGEPTLTFQHRRVHEWPPEGGVSTVCASVPLDQHATQRAMSEALLRQIGWQGPAMVEYRYDAATGRYWLMEINGRFWGSLPLARHAGAHFAWESYARALGIDPAQGEQRERHARYTIPETRRLLRVLFGARTIADPLFRRTPVRDLLSYFGDMLDPGMRYFIWDWRDPGPFFADVANGIRKLLRRGTSLRD